MAGDFSSGEAILANGSLVHSEGFSAVASGGNLVVYPQSGTHPMELWAVTRSGGVWGAPVLLTGSSTYDYTAHPAISDDGSKVVFDCGDQPYAATGTAICEVGTTVPTMITTQFNNDNSPCVLPSSKATPEK